MPLLSRLLIHAPSLTSHGCRSSEYRCREGAIQQAVAEAETQRHQHLSHHRGSAPSPDRIPGDALIYISLLVSHLAALQPRPGRWCLSADDYCAMILLDLLQCGAARRNWLAVQKLLRTYRDGLKHHTQRRCEGSVRLVTFAMVTASGQQCLGGIVLLSAANRGHLKSGASRPDNQLAGGCLLPPATNTSCRCCRRCHDYLRTEHARIVWGLETCAAIVSSVRRGGAHLEACF